MGIEVVPAGRSGIARIDPERLWFRRRRRHTPRQADRPADEAQMPAANADRSKIGVASPLARGVDVGRFGATGLATFNAKTPKLFCRRRVSLALNRRVVLSAVKHPLHLLHAFDQLSVERAPIVAHASSITVDRRAFKLNALNRRRARG